MTVSLNYIHVARGDGQFNDAAKRFVASYKEFPPEHDHRFVVVWCNGEPTSEMKATYDGIQHESVRYDGEGWDIGAQQFAALHSQDEFVVSVNSRVYCHRSGWLKRMMECRQDRGKGVYAAMASFEGCPLGQGWPNPHLRTAFYGMDTERWKAFPHTINSRQDTFRFESGEWNIANWCLAQEKRAIMVTWEGCWEKSDWRIPPNVFRRGDQSNCIVKDRHCDIFQNNPGAQPHLEGLANGTP